MERRAPRPSSPKWPGGAARRSIALELPSPLASAYNPPFLDPVAIRGPVKRIKAIYPGSFDPPTNGHLDLIERGSKIFDELVVAILRNPEKDPLFSVADRRKILEAMTSGLDNVAVDTFDGLTRDYALRVEARRILLR